MAANQKISELDIVELMADLPEYGVRKGERATVGDQGYGDSHRQHRDRIAGLPGSGLHRFSTLDSDADRGHSPPK